MKKFIISLSLLASFVLPTSFVFAQEKVLPITGVNQQAIKIAQTPTWENYVPQEAKQVSDVSKVSKNVINILLLVAGVVAVIVIIIGGYQYVTAGGNADSAAHARSTILNALIGLVIVFAAYALVRFVLDKFLK
jgi:hypothetical protein